MLISTPSSNQLLLQFPTETERKEFEQCLNQWKMVLAKNSGDGFTSEEKILPTPARSIPNDLKLSQIETSKAAAREERLKQINKLKTNREGLLPWRTER